jgi:hypothetical protein
MDPHLRSPSREPGPSVGHTEARGRCGQPRLAGAGVTREERPWRGIARHVLDDAGVTLLRGTARIPYRLPDGREYNAKLRTAGREWWNVCGLPLIPFGLETLPPAEAAADALLVLAEGESDALALRESLSADEATGSQPFAVLALPGATTWRHDWRAYFDPYPLIYVVGDGDDAGRRMMRRVAASIPWARLVHLPDGSDTRSLLQSRGVHALDRYFADADAEATLDAVFRLARTLGEAEALLVRRPA